ncbi:MAG: stage III sporulation protein AG [[Clostridium] scindens]
MDVKKKKRFEIPKNFSIKKLKKDQLLILLLVGILLVVIAIPTGKGRICFQNARSSTAAAGGGEAAYGNYASYMEGHLEGVLSQMAGVGDVTVMITLQSSAEKVVEKDVEAQSETVTESDSQGGTRTTQNSSHGEATVYDGDGSQEQAPYISKELSPQVEGVVVIASGGDNAVVKQNITEAVQALFGIDTHKIRIMKKNS